MTDIGLNANYGSLEAFTRAFRKAFRVSPSLYRRMGATYTHLHASNGIHHHSGNTTRKEPDNRWTYSIFSPARSPGTPGVFSRLAKTLNDEQLDCPLT